MMDPVDWSFTVLCLSVWCPMNDRLLEFIHAFLSPSNKFCLSLLHYLYMYHDWVVEATYLNDMVLFDFVSFMGC